MRLFIACLVALGSMASVAIAGDYCSLSAKHTMCQYKGPSAACESQTIFHGLSQAGKDNILARHNELRRKVAKGNEAGQPAAANMRELIWDDELEEIAQRWADQCQFGHDKDRKMLDGTYIGQNVYSHGSTRKNDNDGELNDDRAPGSVQAWYDEVVKPGFSAAHVNPFVFSYGAGHYTQVVWADTDRVGCGAVYYGPVNTRWYKTLIVCNYAKGGNYRGASMYKEGKACSACPSGTSCNDGLCATKSTGPTRAPKTTKAPKRTKAPKKTEAPKTPDGQGDYCSVGATHTMCQFKGPSESCAAKTIMRGFSKYGKKVMLREHNKLRRKVARGKEKGQPKAANMRELVWDDELAEIAQRWTDQCDYGHDKNRKLLDGTYVGQNAYLSWSTGKSDKKALNKDASKKAARRWYNEVVKPGFSPANIAPFQWTSGVGHYTQMVWADTDRLGCAYTYFKDGRFNKMYIVCNYARGGNMIGSSMYKEGKPCSACPEGTTCNRYLCKK